MKVSIASTLTQVPYPSLAAERETPRPPSADDRPATLGGTPRLIGALLVDSGKLKSTDVDQVVRRQTETGARFGETALALGLIQRDDLDAALARQFSYPYVAPGDLVVGRELVAAYAPEHPSVENIRALRNQVCLHWLDATPLNRTLAVVSTERGEGRTFIAANLATVFCQLGRRTLLVDADLAKPDVHRIFKMGSRSGLSSMLSGRSGHEAVVRFSALAGLSILPAGPIPPNPQDLLARPQLSQLLATLAEEFDVIIVDAPPWQFGSTAQMLAARAGAAVLVTRAHRTPANRAAQFVQTMHDGKTNLLGAVFNRF